MSGTLATSMINTATSIANVANRLLLKQNSLLYSDLNGKDKTTQLNLLKDLEKKPGNVFEIVYGLPVTNTTINNTTWNNPLYMKYDSTINFTNFLHPTGTDPIGFAIKIFSYIDILTDGSYIFTNNKVTTNESPLLNLFLNGYKILDLPTSANIVPTNEVYLKKGTYLLYIEVVSTSTINLTLNLKGSTTTSIDTFISSTPYKLLSNITNKRDESITNYCDTNNLFTSGNVCDTSLKSNDLLNNRVQNACFNKGTKKDILTETKDGKTLFHSNCKKIINDSTINKNISDNAKENYHKWANKVVNDNKINENKDRLEEYLNILNPDQQTFTLNNNLINYCETNSKDSYNIPTNDILCNSIYNRTYSENNLTTKNNSINKIKTNYCTSNDASGKPRYENDPLCKNDYTTLLKDTIQSRCIQGGKYKADDQWCNTLIDNNIKSTQDPYKTIISTRNKLIESQITSATSTQTTPLLDDNTYNYVIGKYNESTSKKLPEELLNQKLYDYCETKETNYPTIDNSQCKGIYNKFSTNQGIIDSQKRMQESLCQLSTNITTSNPKDGKTNAYLCKDTIFNTSDNLAKFATTVATHCATNINSPECTNYYKDIEDKILQQYIQPNVIPVSKFSNINKDTSLHEYQNVVLESYENGTASTEANLSTESNSSTEANSSANTTTDISTEMIESEVVPIESNLIILSENDNYDSMYWILLFIFFLLIITLIYSCSCNKKKTNQEKIPMAIPVVNQ